MPLDSDEPFRPQPNSLWQEGCSAYLERWEYIEARTERYMDHYRELPEYDFDRSGGLVGREQKAVLLSYHRYAEGSLTLEGVADQVKMLRLAYKRDAM